MLRLVNRGIAAVLIVAALLLALPATADAQALPESHQRALAVAAEYLTFGSRDVDRVLSSNDYSPPVPATVWQRVPAIRKLEIAYLEAVNAAPDSGGDEFLALLSQDLARQYESARKSPVLSPFLAKPNPIYVEFKPLQQIPSNPNVPADVRPVIQKIAEVCTIGPNPITILTEDFGLSPTEAYRTLSTSKTIDGALVSAISRHSPAEQRVRVAKASERLAKRYESLRYDAILSPFLPQKPGSPGSDFPGFDPRQPGGGGSGGGGGLPRAKPPAPTRNSAEAYKSFRARNYARPASRGFGRVAVRIGGFGGVVFGNSVKALGIPPPKTISYSAEGSNGKLTITFGDGTAASLEDVSVDEVSAAHAIVYKNVGSDPDDPADAAIGLVSLNPVSLRDCPGGKARYSSAFDVLLHPALVDSDLGWSVLYADALPIAGERMRTTIAKRIPENASALLAVEAFGRHAMNWKITDAPLVIRAAGGRLSVERDATDTPYPEPLRRSAHIEFRPFTDAGYELFDSDEESEEPGPDQFLGTQLYWNTPALLRVFDDYRKLNAFAGVLAVFRWAHSAKAQVASSIPAPTKVSTPEAIMIVDEEITPIRGFTDAEMKRRIVDRCVPATTSPVPKKNSK